MDIAISLENIILFGFAGSAVASGILLRLFFGRWAPPPRQFLTWRRWTAGNALLILFLLSVVLTSGEIYYRYFYDATDAYMMSKTSVRWQTRHYHMNTTGFRDSVEYNWRIQPGLRRITFLGDSFTAGHGVKNG